MAFCTNTARAATPVEKWGQLSVKGTNIVNKNGKKVQLKGVSTHGIAWFPQYVNKSCFKSFKKMGVNTIRIAFYSDPGSGYTTGGAVRDLQRAQRRCDLGEGYPPLCQ